MTAHTTPTAGAKVVVTLKNGDKILGRVGVWPSAGQVRLFEPVNIFPKYAIKDWWYSA